MVEGNAVSDSHFSTRRPQMKSREPFVPEHKPLFHGGEPFVPKHKPQMKSREPFVPKHKLLDGFGGFC